MIDEAAKAAGIPTQTVQGILEELRAGRFLPVISQEIKNSVLKFLDASDDFLLEFTEALYAGLKDRGHGVRTSWVCQCLKNRHSASDWRELEWRTNQLVARALQTGLLLGPSECRDGEQLHEYGPSTFDIGRQLWWFRRAEAASP